MSDPSPRYVLSADGFDIYDRWYCHEQVYTTPRYELAHGDGMATRIQGDYPAAHSCAWRALDTLNAAHEAWLGEDTEARKGKGSR